jgi:hypothetical protein
MNYMNYTQKLNDLKISILTKYEELQNVISKSDEYEQQIIADMTEITDHNEIYSELKYLYSLQKNMEDLLFQICLNLKV